MRNLILGTRDFPFLTLLVQVVSSLITDKKKVHISIAATLGKNLKCLRSYIIHYFAKKFHTIFTKYSAPRRDRYDFLHVTVALVYKCSIPDECVQTY